MAISGVIIQAGGSGLRLGGVSKADYLIEGLRLLDILLTEISLAFPIFSIAEGEAPRIVVVGPPDLQVPRHVRLTLEDPPGGGPLAGIGAGVEALGELTDEALIALATCDAPLAPRLFGALEDALHLGHFKGGSDKDTALENESGLVEGAVPLTADGEGWAQYMHGIYPLKTLRKLTICRDSSVRKAFQGLNLAQIKDTENWCMDVDTPADAARLAAKMREEPA
ncbi:MAG: NTP transferase domain-containing protein [Actinomycetaceae bacterium]|nr:NTP transferase domain-containing protein [Actinomycetaceae bacterium]